MSIRSHVRGVAAEGHTAVGAPATATPATAAPATGPASRQRTHREGGRLRAGVSPLANASLFLFFFFFNGKSGQKIVAFSDSAPHLSPTYHDPHAARRAV